MAVLVSNDFPPAHGGIQRYVGALADALRARGESITVVAPRVAGAAAHDATVPYRVVRYRGRGKALAFFGMLSALARVRLRDSREPLIASIWFPAGLAAALLPPRMRRRLVILAHGSEIAPSRGGFRKRLMRWTFSRAALVAANSTFTAALLAQAGIRNRVAVVPCGVDPFDVPARERTNTIVAVGRLVPRKGFDRLIEAMPAIVREVPDARLLVIGDGPQRNALMELARVLGVTDRVTFAGAIDDAALHEAYAAARVFALPARRIRDDVEGFGIVYLEAAMAGMATIGGRDSGAGDAIADGSTGYLVDGADARAVARAAISLLSDPARAQQMGRAGRARACSRFTWAANAAAIADAIATAR